LSKIKKESLGSKEIIIGGVSSMEKLMLVMQIHAGVRAGYSITDTLELARSQSKGRLKLILTEVIGFVKNGAYLYESFAKYPKYFHPVFINMIKTGELSASLEDSLDQLHIMLNKEAEISQKIRSALVYPGFIFIAIIGLGLSVAFFVLPNILPLFKAFSTELPTSTKILLWIAETSENYGTIIFWAFISFLFLIIWIPRKEFAKPFTHWLILHCPLIGNLYRKITLARFSRTMHSFLKNGIAIDDGLAYTASSMNNIYYRNAIISVLPFIAKGETLTHSLKDYPALFENIFMKMLTLGEKTGSLEQSLLNISDYYTGEVDRQTKNLTTSLEPILLIIVGLLVGFVAIAILGPIYSITGSIT